MPSAIARSLRRTPTEAERQLWSRLRNRQLDGHKFRRQVPLGAYVADFVCLSERLVVEADGGQHAWRSEEDAARTAWLEANGFCVLRFWNNEVLGNIGGVLQSIQLTLRQRAGAPPPHPSPTRGEGDASALAHRAPATSRKKRAKSGSPSARHEGASVDVSLPPCGGGSGRGGSG